MKFENYFDEVRDYAMNNFYSADGFDGTFEFSDEDYGFSDYDSADGVGGTQAAPTSMTITAAWNPSDANLLLIRGDAYSGVIDRTFVISASDGTGIVNYAFNGRVGQFTVDPNPTAEAKCTFTIHPRGNQYGWSNNA